MTGPEISNAFVAIGRLTRVECLFGFERLHTGNVTPTALAPLSVGTGSVRRNFLACAN